MENVIIQKLHDIENEYNVKILYAVESGSRAWGFETPESDWDVRFVYVQSLENYLRPIDNKNRKDVIEWMSTDRLLDFSGWNFNKTLNHISKSNPSISEWLCSKIVYINIDGTRDVLQNLLNRSLCLHSFMHHYRSMAKQNWVSYFENKSTIKVKRYFYIIRSILMLMYINFEKKLYDTIKLDRILEKCRNYIPINIVDEIEKIIDYKQFDTFGKTEIDTVPVLNDWINHWSSHEIIMERNYPIPEKELSQYLHSFSRTYFPETNPLYNPCKHSFKDLLIASGRLPDTTDLYKMTQHRLNNEVKILCSEAGWFWHDVVEDGVVFTSFSPDRKP